jgi:hypothetical protein
MIHAQTQHEGQRRGAAFRARSREVFGHRGERAPRQPASRYPGHLAATRPQRPCERPGEADPLGELRRRAA